MKIKTKVKAILFCFSVVMGSSVIANPASTDYVDSRINALSANMNVLISEKVPKVHQLGESYQGGIIFYVDETGLHGLIAATKDANTLPWQNGEAGERVVNARANGLYAGRMNTKLIIAEQTIDDQEGSFAALAASIFSSDEKGQSPCALSIESSLRCYGDWYLPSLYELTLMYPLKAKLGLSDISYWSSTEISAIEAYSLDFSTGSINVSSKALQLSTRPIRAF